MLNTIISSIAPVIAATAVTILITIIKALGDAVVSFIRTKETVIANKIGVEKYNAEIAVAKNVWNIVDEYFRITPNAQKTIEAAQAKFKEEMLKKVPYLTDADIEHLNQAVAGEINKGKALVNPVQ